MSNFDGFLTIRKTYAKLLPAWMDEYNANGEMRQDPYFMKWQFTPIEQNVWSDIRAHGLPFYPQLPVLNYFLDFGCPFLKIGIECDGKAWHDSKLDKARDERLAAAGWMIFRIEGHECNRMMDPGDRAEFEEEDEYGDRVSAFFQTSGEGVIHAIKHKYFTDDPSSRYEHEIEATLFEHRSTPETFPVRKPFVSSGPMLIGDCMADFIENIMRELQREAV